MKRLIQAIAGLSVNQWFTLIGLLVLLNLVVMGGLLWVISSSVVPEQVSFSQLTVAQAPATRTPYPTFTPILSWPAATPFPSATNTSVPTWTPSITLTPTPTRTPTETPVPTNTPIQAQAQARARPPTATHTPAPTPTPDVDFIGNVRQLTPCENQGKHHIFISVVDEAGNGIPGMSARVSWPSGEATVKTGTKIEDPGLTDFAMFKGSYQVQLIGAVSEIIGPLTPDIPQDQECKENGNPVGNSLFHYSYDVTFKKVR